MYPFPRPDELCAEEGQGHPDAGHERDAEALGIICRCGLVACLATWEVWCTRKSTGKASDTGQRLSPGARTTATGQCA